MEFIHKSEPTKRAQKLLKFAIDRNLCITGIAQRVLKYGLDTDNKMTYCTIETSGGIDESYAGKYDCLADAIQDTNKVISFPSY